MIRVANDLGPHVAQGGVRAALRLFLGRPSRPFANRRGSGAKMQRSIGNVEINRPIRRLMIRAVRRLHHQAITSRREVLHLHHQAARNHRISFPNEIIRRRQSAKENVLVTSALINVIREPTRGGVSETSAGS